MGSVELNPISLEITYGIERISMFLQGMDNCYDLVWARGKNKRDIRYGDVALEQERQFSKYNFEFADAGFYSKLFDMYEGEFNRLLNAELLFPAYDALVHSGHSFNMLDACGAVSVAGRTEYITRIRSMARKAAEAYISLRKALGYPMLEEYTPWRNRNA